ncbi:MAG: hypothetical protein KTR24_02940 [Saprospiraceae bacterium]|nr:hypothetical protein [Saprospiraceae bacterium]
MTHLGFLFCFLWGSLHTGQAHELHLSKALVNYNRDAQALEVSLQIFIDDLELAMKAEGIDGLHIATTKESADADQEIASYLEHYFAVFVDGNRVPFSFLGKETSEDLMAIWCYLEAEDIARPAQLEITYRLLLDVYDDQKNVVTFMADSTREFFLFDQKEFTGIIDL